MPLQVTPIPAFQFRMGFPFLRRESKLPPATFNIHQGGGATNFTNIYCVNGGSNLNAGSDENVNAKYTVTNGGWDTSTRIFTPADGSNPVANGVKNGDMASVYPDGSIVGVFIGLIIGVQDAVNGTITVSTTNTCGASPTTSATARSIKVGGALKGPNGASTYPFGMSTLQNCRNSAGDLVRLCLKNDQIYSMTVTLPINQAPVIVQGYKDVPGDGAWLPGTQGRAIIDAGGNNIDVVSVTSGMTVYDLIAQNNGVNGSAGFNCGSAGFTLFVRCTARNLRVHGFSGSSSTQGMLFVECEATNCNLSLSGSGAGFFAYNGNIYINCYSHDNNGTCDGFSYISNPTFSNIYMGCIAVRNRYGFVFSSGNPGNQGPLYNCEASYNRSDGVLYLATTNSVTGVLYNCNIFGNSGYGINSGVTTGIVMLTLFNCGVCNNTWGNYRNTPGHVFQFVNPVTYPDKSSPYQDPDNGNFTLVSPASLGKGRGYIQDTGELVGGTLGFPDVGAAQASAATGVSSLTLRDGFVNQSYYDSAGYSANTAVTLLSGSLPPGLSLSQPNASSWLISGTPTTAGTYSAILQLVSASGNSTVGVTVTVFADPGVNAGGSALGGY